MEKGSIGANIKKYRTKLNITQQQLADKLSVSRPTIASYESCRTEPDIATMEKLAEIFEITVDELLGKVVDEKQSPSLNKVGLIIGIVLNAVLLIRNMLYYIKNNFLYVEPGAVTEEMKRTLSIRFAISDIIYIIDEYFSPLLVIGFFAIITYSIVYRRKNCAKKLMTTLALIIFSLVINLEFAIMVDANSIRVNYYDVILSTFHDTIKLVIVIIALLISGTVGLILKKDSY